MKLHRRPLGLHDLQYRMDEDAVCMLQIPEANAAYRAYPAMGASSSMNFGAKYNLES